MKKRFIELDLLRGAAIIGMIAYHFFFILNYYEIYGVDFENVTVRIFAQLVRFDFLLLVGVGMVISYYRVLSVGKGRLRAILQQWKRAVVVGLAALVVTGATYWYIPEDFVRFGILHLIAVSIFFWSFFVEWKWLVLALSMVSFWFGGWLSWIGLGGVNFLQELMWNVPAVDFFPIFPWIGLVGLGIFVGHWFYPKGVAKFEWKADGRWFLFRGMGFLGRHSLMIYLLHVPIIMIMLWVMGLVKI